MLLTIGNTTYSSKSAAKVHYRTILNSYDFGQSLNEFDFSDVLDLLNYFPESENKISDTANFSESYENSVFITDIKVSRVQFNTKCFEVFYDDETSHYISYLLCINGKTYSDTDLFNAACRSAISADIHSVKSQYFKDSVNRMVKCQETGILSKWEELVVDHRQPNTFSVIVDRFREINNIDFGTIEYERDGKNNIVFADSSLSVTFREYHREKANLRIVRRECNSERIGLARVKRTNKDLFINN